MRFIALREIPCVVPFALVLASTSRADAQDAPPPMTATLVSIERYSARERVRIDSALVLVRKVINHPEFRAAVLAYGAGEPGRSFVEKDGRTLTSSNEEVWATFTRAAEGYDSVPDGDMDLHLVGKHRFLRWPFGMPGYPVGFGNGEEDPPIYTYHTWLRENSENAIAGHIVHEWTHKIGYEHDFNYRPNRPCSVPYALGEMVVHFAKQLQSDAELGIPASGNGSELRRCQAAHSTP